MRILLLACCSLLLFSGPVAAQTSVALSQVTEGWGRGQCNLLTHVAVNPETGNWETIDPSPWSTWTIQKVGPQSVEFTMAMGVTRRVDFEEGVYRERSPDDAEASAGDSSEWTIEEHGVFASDNWRLLLLHPRQPGQPEGVQSYSEMIMAGNVFVWTNWLEMDGEVRQRGMYYACELEEAGDMDSSE